MELTEYQKVMLNLAIGQAAVVSATNPQAALVAANLLKIEIVAAALFAEQHGVV